MVWKSVEMWRDEVEQVWEGLSKEVLREVLAPM